MKYRLTVKGQVALMTVLLITAFAVGYSVQFSHSKPSKEPVSAPMSTQTAAAEPEASAPAPTGSEPAEETAVQAPASEIAFQAEQGKITETVYFQPDQWTMTSEEIPKIADMADQLTKDSALQIVIEGNINGCPGSKDSAFGTDLSLKRAQVVAQVLIGKGIDESRITVKSNGSSAPATQDEDKAWMNRRADIYIEGFKGDTP